MCCHSDALKLCLGLNLVCYKIEPGEELESHTTQQESNDASFVAKPMGPAMPENFDAEEADLEADVLPTALGRRYLLKKLSRCAIDGCMKALAWCTRAICISADIILAVVEYACLCS